MVDTEVVVLPTRKRPAEQAVDIDDSPVELTLALQVSEGGAAVIPSDGQPQVIERRRFIPVPAEIVNESLYSKLLTYPVPLTNPKPWQMRVGILERHHMCGLFARLVHPYWDVHEVTDPRMREVIGHVKRMEHTMFEEAEDRMEYRNKIRTKVGKIRTELLNRKLKRMAELSATLSAAAETH